MKPVSPVIEDEKLPFYVKKLIYAENQPEYQPLPALAIPGVQGQIITRWELTDEELEKLIDSKSIYLSVYTFGQPLQPLSLTVETPIITSLEDLSNA